MSPALNFDPQSPEITAIDLARALDRLERKILSTPPEPRLLYDSYERTKTAANLEYARTLLLRLEHTSSQLKIQSRRQQAQTTLLAQRALLKRLTDRLHELDQQDLDWPSDASQDEDLLSDDEAILPRPTATALDLDKRNSPSDPPHAFEEPGKPGLRNRFAPVSPIKYDAPSPTSPSFPGAEQTPTQRLETNDMTQESLTAGLSTLSSQLKANATLFSQSLEADKEAMSSATEALDKNAAGMEVAGKRMSLLRRMNEGQGWWGRMMLYAWIAGLWVVAILLVFVGPKFRF